MHPKSSAPRKQDLIGDWRNSRVVYPCFTDLHATELVVKGTVLPFAAANAKVKLIVDLRIKSSTTDWEVPIPFFAESSGLS